MNQLPLMNCILFLSYKIQSIYINIIHFFAFLRLFKNIFRHNSLYKRFFDTLLEFSCKCQPKIKILSQHFLLLLILVLLFNS